jgi:hypothetical protein
MSTKRTLKIILATTVANVTTIMALGLADIVTTMRGGQSDETRVEWAVIEAWGLVASLGPEQPGRVNHVNPAFFQMYGGVMDRADEDVPCHTDDECEALYDSAADVGLEILLAPNDGAAHDRTDKVRADFWASR